MPWRWRTPLLLATGELIRVRLNRLPRPTRSSNSAAFSIAGLRFHPAINNGTQAFSMALGAGGQVVLLKDEADVGATEVDFLRAPHFRQIATQDFDFTQGWIEQPGDDRD